MQVQGQFRLVLAATTLAALACNNDGLGREIALLRITPLPTSGQSVLENPVGLNLGQVALFGYETATFEIMNISTAKLELQTIAVSAATGGDASTSVWMEGIQQTSWPVTLRSQETATLRVDLTAYNDEQVANAQLAIQTNAGRNAKESIPLQVQGTGWFIGEPNLEVEYNGVSYALPTDCTFEIEGDDSTPCLLNTFEFGNVSLGAEASGTLILRNVPAADTCLLPSLADGSPDCSAACAITVDRGSLELGLGVTPTDSAFSLVGVGASSLPFELAPAKPACSSAAGLVRGDLKLLVNFTSGDTEGDSEATFVLESNDPGARVIKIPLHAMSREAPVAVATLRACDTDNPPPSCSTEDGLEPLGRVYLDGRTSYDPQGGSIVAYDWQVIDAPDGVGSSQTVFNMQGQGTSLFSLYMPLAGTYKVRLRVTNDTGIQSGISQTSDVEFVAIPASRVHLQLVWDNAVNDMDLHLVNATLGDMIYHSKYDCFWEHCRPSCATSAACAPTHWFTDEAAFDGPNPRLDIDDRTGLGPENINIDRPAYGSYHIYVHYYGIINQVDDTPPTLVTVRVYVDGTLREELRRTLYRNDLWAVAKIEWASDNTGQVSAANADGDNVVGSVKQLGWIPYPNGYTFNPSPF